MSAEAAEREEIMQRQHWEPCVKVLAFMGHSLSKIIAFYPKRCSYCGNFIFGLCENVYICHSCRILCHSTCVENIKKSCKEIQSVVKEKTAGLTVQGHQFEQKVWKFKRCIKCKNFAIAFFEKCLQCKECKAILHDCCVSLLEKNCPSLFVSQGYKVLTDEENLLSQNFKCPDCNAPIFEESKDCQYCYFSKRFFCLSCHSNKEAIIPENVLKKWCFCPHPVSDWSKLYLNYMKDRPVIAAEDISTKVMAFNGEMFNIMLLLEDIKNYYDYLPDCQKEFDDILKQIRKNWPNLLQSPVHFSLSNLHDIFASFKKANDSVDAFYPQLVACHEKIVSHVRRECQECIGQAQKCMACDYKGTDTTTENAIFYFERTIISCQNKKCTPLNCMHRSCLKKKPFFVCQGCDTQMLNCEEFSLYCNKPVEAEATELKDIDSNTSQNEGSETEQEMSEITCISKDNMQPTGKKLSTFIRCPCMGACGTSERTLAKSKIFRDSNSENVPKDFKFSVSVPVLPASTSFCKSPKTKDSLLPKTENAIKNLEYYLVFCSAVEKRLTNSNSQPEQTALCSSLFKQLENVGGQPQQQNQNTNDQNLPITQHYQK